MVKGLAMQYTVSIRRNMIHRLDGIAQIIEQRPLLARDFVTCLIETELTKDQFWAAWRK